MRHRSILPLLLAVGAAFAPSLLAAQATPLGEPFQVCTADFCAHPEAAALPGGGFATSYMTTTRLLYDRVDACELKIFPASGGLPMAFQLDSGSISTQRYPALPDIAPDFRGGVAAAWYLMTGTMHGIVVRWFREDASPLTPGPVLAGTAGDGYCAATPTVATNETGWTVVAWEDPCPNAPALLGLRLFGPDRKPRSPILRLAPRGSHPGRPRTGIAPSGRFTVVWVETVEGAQILRGQTVSADGRFLDPPFEISEPGEPVSHLVRPDGRIFAVWKSTGPDGARLWFQGYTPRGTPAGPPVEPAAAPIASFFDLSADSHGNFVVFWLAETEALLGRLYNQDLVPQGEAFELDSASISTALSSSGRFLCTWIQGDPRLFVNIWGGLWQVRHEADACLRRGKRFLCDTGNNGAPAEAILPLGEGRSDETPFLADWDGDGRADPCLYREGRFFCDTAHDGGADVRSLTVGAAGDLPLLGDLNGDGRADPCVRRGTAFLCDIARDGGSKDLRIVFGVAGDTVLLGDPDGDGRDDPCLLRSGRLLCDTVHNGGGAELKLDLRPLGVPGPVLLGDVNGDGRDEACRFTGSRFVCGVYPAAGGVPSGTVEIVLGRPGDIPLLGDLDAF